MMVGGVALALVQQRQSDKQYADLLASINGGDSFAYMWVDANTIKSGDTAQTWIIRNGKFPLFNLTLEITDMNNPSVNGNMRIGEMSGGGEMHGQPLAGPGLRVSTPEGYYRLLFTARNGVWSEDIQWKKSPKNGQLIFASRVLGQSKSLGAGDHKPSLLSEDSQYYSPEFGQPVWRE
jgi:hypothetical protein